MSRAALNVFSDMPLTNMAAEMKRLEQETPWDAISEREEAKHVCDECGWYGDDPDYLRCETQSHSGHYHKTDEEYPACPDCEHDLRDY